MPKPTLSSQNIEVFTLTGDGVDTYWYIEKTPAGALNRISHRPNTGTVSSIRELESGITFYEAIEEANNLLMTLTANDQGVNVNEDAESNGVQSEMEAPTLTDAFVNDIAGWYDPVGFSEKLGALRLVKRFLQLNHINWTQAQDIYIYLKDVAKTDLPGVQPEINYLVNNAVITQQQADDFFILFNL